MSLPAPTPPLPLKTFPWEFSSGRNLALFWGIKLCVYYGVQGGEKGGNKVKGKGTGGGGRLL